MGAATDDIPYVIEEQEGDLFGDLPLAASQRVFAGCWVGESAPGGYARPLVPADVFFGFAPRQCPPESRAVVATNGYDTVRVQQRGVFVGPVTGATGVADEGSTVYASDDNTLTLTAGSNTAIGKVIRYDSGTTCAVYFEAVSVRSL